MHVPIINIFYNVYIIYQNKIKIIYNKNIYIDTRFKNVYY